MSNVKLAIRVRPFTERYIFELVTTTDFEISLTRGMFLDLIGFQGT